MIFSIFSAVSRQIKFYLIIKIEVGVMIIVSLVPGTFKGCAEPVQGRAKPICVQYSFIELFGKDTVT